MTGLESRYRPLNGTRTGVEAAVASREMGALRYLRRRRKRGPVAFVLSGGGNLGAVQVGMLRALLEHEIYPDLILGCSVGALNGAALADDPSLAGVGRLDDLWRSVDGKDLMPRNWLPNAVALARRGEAIHDSEGLRKMLEAAMGGREFKDLVVRFECVATDVKDVKEVWFNHGPLLDAILASAAMPAVYPSVEINGARYLDGAIVNDVPMSRAVELGASTLYVLQVGSFSRPRAQPRRPLDVAVQAYWIARHHRFKRDLEAMPQEVDLHLLPHGQPPVMRYNDFTRAAELISAAYQASTDYLEGRGVPDEALAAPPAMEVQDESSLPRSDGSDGESEESDDGEEGEEGEEEGRMVDHV
jgi:NTE family protein